MDTLLRFLFRCPHRNLSRPITPLARRGCTAATYVVCLDCGTQYAYDWEAMRIGPPVRQRAAVEGRVPVFSSSQKSV